MPSTTPQKLDVRRRRLLYRAWHRGTREMDLILGRFADRYILSLPEEDLTALEQLMEAPEQDLLRWILGQADIPTAYSASLIAALRCHAEEHPVAL